MSDFPGTLGIIGQGDGKVVFPEPTIQPGWNTLVRGTRDGEFRWGLVTGLEPDPSLGYQFAEPASYRLEITPDLGWPNPEALFESYVHGTSLQGNALLTIIRDLRVGIELEVQSDSSVIYTIPEAVMKSILAPGFDTYFWRVMAVSPAGHAGHPSDLQAFRGRVIVVNIAWTVREPDSPARAMTATITGTREASVTRIEVNGEPGYTSFPTASTWKAEVPLGRGRNALFIRAFDSTGNGSEYRQVDVDVTSEELETKSYFNRFDDLGYLMGLKRLPEERNHPYRERIKDVLVHRGGPDYQGLMNAVSRELALTSYDQALLLKPAVNPQTSRRWLNVSVWLTARHFYVRRSDATAVQERVEVEGRTLQVHPARVAAGPMFLVETEPGVEVNPDHYDVRSSKDGPYVQFLREEYSGAVLRLTYQYVERIDVVDRTLDELVTALNALTINGAPVIEVTKHSTISGSRPATSLQKFPPVPLAGGPFFTAGNVEVDSFPVRWVPVELNAFMDPEFKERHRNANGTFFGTAYGAWAYALKSKLKTTWGYLISDENVWSSPVIRVSGLGSLDLIYDAYRGGWTSDRGGYLLGSHAAAARGYIDPRDGAWLRFDGVPWDFYWSGAGPGLDLFSIIDLDPTQLGSTEEELEIIRQLSEGNQSTFEDMGIGQDEVTS